MPPVTIVDPLPKTATRLTWAILVRQWIQYLNSVIGNILSPGNSNFEQVSSGTVPDGWEFTSYPGGTGGVDNSTSASGTNSFYFATGGVAGGGFLQSQTEIPYNPGQGLYVSFWYQSSAPTMSNKIEILWFKKDGTACSTPKSMIWAQATGNPSTWTFAEGCIASPDGDNTLFQEPPSDAVFYGVLITGGVPGSAVAGSFWIDDLKFQQIDPTFPKTDSYTVRSAPLGSLGSPIHMPGSCGIYYTTDFSSAGNGPVYVALPKIGSGKRILFINRGLVLYGTPQVYFYSQDGGGLVFSYGGNDPASCSELVGFQGTWYVISHNS